MTYRTDINGLRGLAIALVVGFHAFPNIVPNGYLGVDIFFVISGFLITSIVFREISSGEFTFPNFFARRIKRLLPAATAVLLATTIFANLTLFDKEWFSYLRNLKAVFGFHLNYQLISEAGYFDTASNLKPLLHFWSLNLEEQFYLIWPLCIFLLLKKFKAKATLIFKLNFLLIALSLSQFMSFDGENYYSLTARAWQLLAGAQIALAANILKDYKYLAALKNYSSFLVAGGLLSLMMCQLIEIRQMATLFAILGTSLLIIAGNSRLKNVYDNVALGALGLISYSFYLWHWPILSFLRIFYGSNLSNVTLGIAILASLFFSIFTYMALEKPLAKQKWSFSSFQIPKLYNAPAAYAVAYGICFLLSLHIPRLSNFDLSGSNAELLPNVKVGIESCFIENPISAWCQSEQPTTDKKIRAF